MTSLVGHQPGSTVGAGPVPARSALEGARRWRPYRYLFHEFINHQICVEKTEPLPELSNFVSPPALPWLYPTLKTEGQGPALMP